MSKYLEKQLFKREGGRWGLPTSHKKVESIQLNGHSPFVLATKKISQEPLIACFIFPVLNHADLRKKEWGTVKGGESLRNFVSLVTCFCTSQMYHRRQQENLSLFVLQDTEMPLAPSMLCSESRIFKYKTFWKNSVLPFCFNNHIFKNNFTIFLNFRRRNYFLEFIWYFRHNQCVTKKKFFSSCPVTEYLSWGLGF